MVRRRPVGARSQPAGEPVGETRSTIPTRLRLILAEPVAEAGEVVTLSADMDDLSPEYLEPLREALVAAGALDVQVWPTQMKKGRVGFRVEVVCATPAVQEVTEALFMHSTTAGVRRAVAERVTLPRRQIEVVAPDGSPVSVKVLETPSGPRVKAEYEDVRRAASRLGRPAHELAREIETGSARAGSRSGLLALHDHRRSRHDEGPCWCSAVRSCGHSGGSRGRRMPWPPGSKPGWIPECSSRSAR